MDAFLDSASPLHPEMERPWLLDDAENWFSESSVEESDLDDLLMGIGLQGQDTGDTVDLMKKNFKKKRKRREAFSGKTTRKTRKKTAATPSEMTAEITQLMEKANTAYLEGNCLQAIELLEEVIRQAPGLHDPFHILGLIYEEEYNDKPKAIDYYILAAHLVPGDAALWKRIGMMSQELGKLEQAIYCFKRCIRNSSKNIDKDAVFELAQCYFLKQNYEKAAIQFQTLFVANPGDPTLGRELARSYHLSNKSDQAITVLEQCVNRNELSLSKIDPHCLNMLCELYLEKKQYNDCMQLLRQITKDHPFEVFPIDLLIKLAASEAHSGDIAVTDRITHILLETTSAQSEFYDLYLMLADAYYDQNEYPKAIYLYQLIENLTEVSADVAISIKVAKCYLHENEIEKAVSILNRCIRANEELDKSAAGIRDADARLLLCDLLGRLGREHEADEMLLSISYKDLREADTLPSPLSNDRRLKLLNFIQSELDNVLEQNNKQPGSTDTDQRV